MNSSDSSISPGLAAMHEVSQQSYPCGALYVVATPLGNVGDISLRALHLLTIADVIACEDTRNTSQLLSRFGLKKHLLAAHQHNEREVTDALLGRLRAGERVALVSDAGTPAISDPGARIVDAVIKAGLRVLPLPGPSAGIAALSASGLLSDAFHFVGFLPAKAGQRDTVLATLAQLPATLVLYEAPHRICETVEALASALGGTRQIVIARELTKLFEQIHRCPLSEAAQWLRADSNHQRGEFVLLVEGAPVADQDQAETDRILQILLAECPLKQAAAIAAKITGQKKNALYDRALVLKSSAENDAPDNA